MLTFHTELEKLFWTTCFLIQGSHEALTREALYKNTLIYIIIYIIYIRKQLVGFKKVVYS